MKPRLNFRVYIPLEVGHLVLGPKDSEGILEWSRMVFGGQRTANVSRVTHSEQLWLPSQAQSQPQISKAGLTRSSSGRHTSRLCSCRSLSRCRSCLWGRERSVSWSPHSCACPDLALSQMEHTEACRWAFPPYCWEAQSFSEVFPTRKERKVF